jgi:hypothetical protein
MFLSNFGQLITVGTILIGLTAFGTNDELKTVGVSRPLNAASWGADQSKELAWNYYGSIHKYPIRAYINYGPADQNGAGGLVVPIKGYYFYEKTHVKIPLDGYCYGNGYISLTARTKDGRESFEGHFTDSMLEDFAGTWSNASKSFSFTLVSK